MLQKCPRYFIALLPQTKMMKLNKMMKFDETGDYEDLPTKN